MRTAVLLLWYSRQKLRKQPKRKDRRKLQQRRRDRQRQKQQLRRKPHRIQKRAMQTAVPVLRIQQRMITITDMTRMRILQNLPAALQVLRLL